MITTNVCECCELKGNKLSDSYSKEKQVQYTEQQLAGYAAPYSFGVPFEFKLFLTNYTLNWFLSVLFSCLYRYHMMHAPLSCVNITFQVIWYPGPCTTSSRCTSRTPATGRQSTRRPPTPRCTGSPRPSTPCVTSCTAHRWSGRTPTSSPPKSPYRLRGESGHDADLTLVVQLKTVVL